MPILIQPDELADRLAAEQAGASTGRTVVLDVRWTLAEPDGRDAYRAGHVPGAVYVDLDHELADHSVEGAGRHPLETGDVVPDPGDATAHFGHMPLIDIDGAAAFSNDGVLLDARAAERYRGEVEPIDPRAGHIPGAVSAPSGDNLDAEGRFLDPGALRDRFAAVGVRPGEPVAAYCGSGVTAAHEVAALAIAGVDAALFPGSWSQWSNDRARPVATGAEAGW